MCSLVCPRFQTNIFLPHKLFTKCMVNTLVFEWYLDLGGITLSVKWNVVMFAVPNLKCLIRNTTLVGLLLKSPLC